jgi:hypothetical protein
VTIEPKATPRPHAGDPAVRPARAARRDHTDAVAAALRLLHDAGVPAPCGTPTTATSTASPPTRRCWSPRAGVHGRERHHAVLGRRASTGTTPSRAASASAAT